MSAGDHRGSELLSAPSARSWLLATIRGWAVGLGLIVALAFVADAIGLGGTQSFVGLGAALGVAWGQRRVVPADVGLTRWIRLTVLGVGAPFLLFDGLGLVGLAPPWSLAAATAMGGVLAGWLQSPVLAPWVTRGMWTVVTSVGWALGAGATFLANEVSNKRLVVGVPGLLLFLTLAMLGGPALGLCQAWVLRRAKDA